MTKLLLVVIGLFIAYWLLKSYKKKVERRNGEASEARDEDMVRCAQCGIHLPRGESLTTEGAFYCSADHRRAHQKRD